MSRSAAHPMRLRPRAAGALLTGLALIAGCAHRPPPPAPPPRTPTASPAVRGLDHGLELWWWIVSDPHAVPPLPTSPIANADLPPDPPTEGPGVIKRIKPPKRPDPVHYIIHDDRVSLEAALRPYLERPVPLSPELRDRWRVCGLRVVAVPVAELPAIEKAVRIVGPVHRQWLGEVPDWTDLIGGPWTQAGPVCGEDGVVRLDAGRMRLLGRCWSVPVAAQGPMERAGATGALRLELVPQHQPQLTDAQKLARRLGPALRPAEQGTLFERLAFGATIESRDALVIVPDFPSAEWSDEAPVPAAPDIPAVLAVPTPGELMLATPARDAAPRTRAVIILIPHPRERFELLP